MERQMKSHYTIRKTNTIKESYYCSSQVAPTDGVKQKNTTYICPSNIVIREFTKGIQVHFYKQHFGHDHGEYILPNKYRKFLIKSFINTEDEEPEEKDLYVQFKTLMECIMLDAAKINVHSLKILIEKALDMSSILANYNEDDDILSSKDPNLFKIITNKEKALTDKQITKALNAMMNSTKPKLTKRPNILTSTPKVGNVVVVPLPKQEESKRTIKEVLPAKRTNTIPVQEVTPAKHTRSKSVHFVSDVVKSPSVTLVETPKSQINFPAKKTILEEEINKNDTKSVTNLPKTNQETQPSSFNDSYKVFVDTLNNTKTNIKNTSKTTSNKTEKLKKSILKTKIGQFMPNTNKTSPNKSPIKSPVDSKTKISKVTKFSKVKIDKYEVREQENDCNILILKI
uniref:Glutathione S-transferase 15 n=1 Tax=Streltzoviella insularis TaxID=1206366 RepID=A0A7D5UMV7_9NEOP|nr:glutathione S-transferase 15 [Streltzoviella insularis]